VSAAAAAAGRTSQAWQRHLSNTSSEGERMMMQALVDSSHGCRRGVVLQFVKMLAVIALPRQQQPTSTYSYLRVTCRQLVIALPSRQQQPTSTCSYLCVTCRQLVIALPMAAVVGLVSYTLHSSRVERASQLSAVEQFRVFEDVEHLETSIRAERGYTTSAVLLTSVVLLTSAVLLLRSAVLLTSRCC